MVISTRASISILLNIWVPSLASCPSDGTVTEANERSGQNPARELHSLSYPGPEGWNQAKPGELGVNSTRLRLAMQKLSGRGPIGHVHVSRWGTEIWTEGNVATARAVWSIGKTLTALCFGRLQQSGAVNSLDDFVPNSTDPAAMAAALGMSDALFGAGLPGGSLRTHAQFASMTSDFGLPAPDPGRRCAYNCAAVDAWAAYLQAVSGSSNSVEMVDKLLFRPLGGRLDALRLATPYLSGWGGGIELSPRDVARLGVLLLSGGRWRDQRLLPDWSVAAFQRRVGAGTVVAPDEPPPGVGAHLRKYWNIVELSRALPLDVSGHPGRMGGDIGYGLGLWLMPQKGAVHMSGVYGNYVIVDVRTGLVVSVQHASGTNQHPDAPAYLTSIQSALVDIDLMSENIPFRQDGRVLKFV
eukprot:TRINITY_DN57747_c0_g1_i1.p1 TRINITY_DN57747_c0_g1~~TRINITY_DN57747_c0_g1_i1.p1  ORF type:complete len:412 (-),score=40.71 TRINITY_DN57747_c0_g1_i1:279-1514(-)